jgi:hypothetical protein
MADHTRTDTWIDHTNEQRGSAREPLRARTGAAKLGAVHQTHPGDDSARELPAPSGAILSGAATRGWGGVRHPWLRELGMRVRGRTVGVKRRDDEG